MCLNDIMLLETSEENKGALMRVHVHAYVGYDPWKKDGNDHYSVPYD